MIILVEGGVLEIFLGKNAFVGYACYARWRQKSTLSFVALFITRSIVVAIASLRIQVFHFLSSSNTSIRLALFIMEAITFRRCMLQRAPVTVT